MKNIIIITSDSLRHDYFRISFSMSKDLNILKTYVEKKDISSKNTKEHESMEILNLHFEAREKIEEDFFSDVINFCEDNSKPFLIEKNSINTNKIIQEIQELNPDFIITYGCSIIKPKLINLFRNRIINVHLGLSPYYFGAGTNYHCLVNNELQFEGYTFMYLDEGVDTGKIIHQSRAKFVPFDNPHQVGNRLIKNMTRDFIKLIINFKKVKDIEINNFYQGKTYKIKDATAETTLKLYENFKKDCVLNYLKNKESIDKKYPIIEQDFLKVIL